MWTRKDARRSALTNNVSLLEATKFLTLASLNIAQPSILAFGSARFCWEVELVDRPFVALQLSIAIYTDNWTLASDFDQPVDGTLSEIHYRVPFRFSPMTKTKECFPTQTRRKVFSAGKQWEWSELHARSEPLRATLPVKIMAPDFLGIGLTHTLTDTLAPCPTWHFARVHTYCVRVCVRVCMCVCLCVCVSVSRSIRSIKRKCQANVKDDTQ